MFVNYPCAQGRVCGFGWDSFGDDQLCFWGWFLLGFLQFVYFLGFGLVCIETLMESLILAQDERWRRA